MINKSLLTILLAAIVLLAGYLRFPGTQLELRPLNYCDEDIYTSEALKMVENRQLGVPHFRSGGLNFIIPKQIGVALKQVYGKSYEISDNDLRLYSRYFANIGLSSLATIFIFLTGMLFTSSRFY